MLCGDLQPDAALRRRRPDAPEGAAREGDAYRDGSSSRSHRPGPHRHRDASTARYRDTVALGALVDSADVVLLPYDSTDQVTSGVLIEAVAALKPVVATRFPHAIELLGDGAGLARSAEESGSHRGRVAYAFHRPRDGGRHEQGRGATAPELLWSNVAGRYLELADHLISTRVAA